MTTEVENTQPLQADEYLNMKAASRVLGASRQWLTALANEGGVPGVVVHGGFRLFERGVFEPWAAEQRAKRKRPPLTKK